MGKPPEILSRLAAASEDVEVQVGGRAETGRWAAAGEAEALLAGQRRRWTCACGGVISRLLGVRAARGLGNVKLPDDPHAHVLAHLAGELVQQQVGRADGVVIAQQILVGGIAEQGGIVDKHAAP